MVHRCILISDYSEFLIHKAELQALILILPWLLVSSTLRYCISLIGSSSTSVALLHKGHEGLSYSQLQSL